MTHKRTSIKIKNKAFWKQSHNPKQYHSRWNKPLNNKHNPNQSNMTGNFSKI